MRNFTFIARLAMDGLTVAGIAGFTSSAFVDAGSAVVIGAVVALGIVVIGIIEWRYRRSQEPSIPDTTAQPGWEQDTHRPLDELRAARTGTGRVPVSHALRSI